MDRRQNNGSVKAVSPRHCPATCALRLFQLLCLGRVTKSVALLLTNNLDNSKRKKSNIRSPAHLPTHDLFWANLKVQLHLPPLRSLDLLISPGTLCNDSDIRCSPFVHALSKKAGAGQFKTDFLPLTAWSQVPPVSLSVSLCA